jgi:hypothetical protein
VIAGMYVSAVSPLGHIGVHVPRDTSPRDSTGACRCQLARRQTGVQARRSESGRLTQPSASRRRASGLWLDASAKTVTQTVEDIIGRLQAESEVRTSPRPARRRE